MHLGAIGPTDKSPAESVWQLETDSIAFLGRTRHSSLADDQRVASDALISESRLNEYKVTRRRNPTS